MSTKTNSTDSAFQRELCSPALQRGAGFPKETRLGEAYKGFRAWGFGIGVEGLGFNAQGLGFRAQGLRFRDKGLGA